MPTLKPVVLVLTIGVKPVTPPPRVTEKTTFVAPETATVRLVGETVTLAVPPLAVGAGVTVTEPLKLLLGFTVIVNENVVPATRLGRLLAVIEYGSITL
jgi:hypothetical protein